MYYEKSYQENIVQNELNTSPRCRRNRNSSGFLQNAWEYLVIFFETSSVHGLRHLAETRRHFLEIFLWLSVMALSVYGSVSLSASTWLRYQSSPTVVSMERDMFSWNTTFPCVTICPHKKIDPKKLEALLRTHEGDDKQHLEEFLRALVNATYDNFDKIPEYNAIPPEDFMKTIQSLSFNFAPTLTIGAAGVNLFQQPTITERGLCYSINSKAAVYNSPQYRDDNRWDEVKTENKTFFVHPLDGEVFAQVINLSTAYDVFFHGPLEVPDLVSKSQRSPEDFYMKIYVTASAIYTSEQAASLRIAQRKCRFPNENNLLHNAIYTYNMCRMECRVQLSLKYCGCVPHFYRTLKNEKVCDVKGLHCLAPFENDFYSLPGCNCLPNCDDVNYVIQTIGLKEWFLGTNLQWGIITYPRMRFKRDIIFGFTDVLVAVGSTAGLFLGCSVLSFVEIVYFLTLRLFWYIVKGRYRRPANDDFQYHGYYK